MVIKLDKDLKSVVKKHKLDSYFFYGQEDDDSDEYYIVYECSNLMIMRMIAGLLFMNDGFKITRDAIISNVLRFIDPQRATCRKNKKGECEKVPFIPDC